MVGNIWQSLQLKLGLKWRLRYEQTYLDFGSLAHSWAGGALAQSIGIGAGSGDVGVSVDTGQDSRERYLGAVIIMDDTIALIGVRVRTKPSLLSNVALTGFF
ncbi:MAG: hypothetical protein EOP09_05380 [Proteobacteria bacterium]|nr:MAG: hypothetical protein EOP09_05380 [Pseudomonadota bacterium]